MTHGAPTHLHQPQPQTVGKAPRDSGRVSSLGRMLAGLCRAPGGHSPGQGHSTRPGRAGQGHILAMPIPQLSLVYGQSQQGTQGVARSGAVCPAGRMAGPCLSRCKETPQPLTKAAVGPKEPGGAAASPGGRITGAPVETPTQQLTARPEPPRRAPCGVRGQLPGSGGSQSPSPPGHHSCGPGGWPGQYSRCWQLAPW